MFNVEFETTICYDEMDVPVIVKASVEGGRSSPWVEDYIVLFKNTKGMVPDSILSEKTCDLLKEEIIIDFLAGYE